MQMSAKQAQAVRKLFDLPDEAVLLCSRCLTKVRCRRGSHRSADLSFLRARHVYGSTFKALIHEIRRRHHSAIDFDLDLTRLPHEKGDRVKIVMSAST